MADWRAHYPREESLCCIRDHCLLRRAADTRCSHDMVICWLDSQMLIKRNWYVLKFN